MFIDNFVCDWCSQELGDYYLTGVERPDSKQPTEQHETTKRSLCFCNFVCAKHYNDIIHKIAIDMDKYTDYYINNKLSKFNEKIYKFVSKRGFEFMPMIYNQEYPTDENKRREMVQEYIAKVYERK